jgi:hypothetical protein
LGSYPWRDEQQLAHAASSRGFPALHKPDRKTKTLTFEKESPWAISVSTFIDQGQFRTA